MFQRLMNLGRRSLSPESKRRLVKLFRWPPVGFVYKGSFRRLRPISKDWGFDRGQPVDRYYIEGFIRRQQGDIRGKVLEIGTNYFTTTYGEDQVTESVVLHVAEQKEMVTLIADLTEPDSLPENAFDCLIITQTLNAIFALDAAVQSIFRALKPGGVALVTVPGISKVSRYDMDRWGYYWAFTTLALQKLFCQRFPENNVTVAAQGNVLASIAFLHGLAYTELTRRQLDFHDPDYQLLITLRAVKPGLETGADS